MCCTQFFVLDIFTGNGRGASDELVQGRGRVIIGFRRAHTMACGKSLPTLRPQFPLATAEIQYAHICEIAATPQLAKGGGRDEQSKGILKTSEYSNTTLDASTPYRGHIHMWVVVEKLESKTR